jgi:tetratricopeptide (TPR) repeat protein
VFSPTDSAEEPNFLISIITMVKIQFTYLKQSIVLVGLAMYSIVGISAPSYPDRVEILSLLENRQFDDLQTLLQRFQSNYEQGKGDEKLIAFVLETLANSNPDFEVLLNEWVASQAESYVPYLARAYYFYGVAWSWRGNRRDEETSADRLDRMKDVLELVADDLSQAILIKPQLSVADALAVRVLMMLGNDDYKKKIVKEALEISPDTYLVRASYLWSLKPEWNGQPDDLMLFIKETGELTEKYPQLNQLLGYADYIFADSLTEQKRFEEADVHFDFAIDKGADHIIYRERGINYYQLKEYELALQDFNQSLSLWPQDPKVLRWRAHTLQRLSKDEAAMLDLELAVRLAPLERYTLMAHAYLSRKMKRYEQVLKLYKNALFYNPLDADIWFDRGMHYSHELVNFEAAARDLKRATELDPDNSRYWYEYAAVLHFNLNCEIVEPLEKYLQLCKAGSRCRAGELEWVIHAQQWLEENNRC